VERRIFAGPTFTVTFYRPAPKHIEVFGVSFEDKILRAAEKNKTRTVLALDLEDADASLLLKRSREVLQSVRGLICGVKINRQLIMELGLNAVRDSIIKLANDFSLPTIMDAKLNDVGHTNGFMARIYFDMGFDAVIASPIAGWENGLDTVFEAANLRRKGVLLLTYMSNPGAETFYSLMANQTDGHGKPVFEILTNLAVEWKAQGVIVGATQPRVISRVRQLAGPNLPIYSPGVGAQGGDSKAALDAGSTYLIVGRSIYNSSDPAKAAMELRRPIES
jgi:orotidine-5'-phosphate decarboxylase